MTKAPSQSSGRALVLAAHGSRRRPEGNALVRRLAQAVRERRLFDEVAVAFHQGEPGFETVLDELAADEITVVPLLTSAGHYADVVLPEALSRNQRYGEVRLRQTPPVGTHPGIAPLVARRMTEVFRQHDVGRHSASVIVVGHGTPKHPDSRTATLDLVETLRRRRVAGEVVAAFIDDEPRLQEVVSRESRVEGRRSIVLVPFLIGGGAHVLEDIPAILTTHASRLSTDSRPSTLDSRLVIDQPIGEYPGLVEIIIDLARRHAPPPPRFRARGRSLRIVPGRVHLVGGGPGDPGLITVRGADLLRSADVVIHDRLIGPELLAQARADALLIDVGKGPGHAPYSQVAINALLVAHATQGRTVVRLKGGDPFVFGRGSEEVEACRRAGVEVQMVPGITSAIAAPAAAGIPVTARGIAQSFAIITGHVEDDKSAESSRAAGGRVAIPSLPVADTIIILMGRANLAYLAAQLIAAGRDPNTPAACIQSATTPAQRVTRATLATIAAAADRDGLESPVVTIVGNVAALGDAELTEVSALPTEVGNLAAG